MYVISPLRLSLYFAASATVPEDEEALLLTAAEDAVLSTPLAVTLPAPHAVQDIASTAAATRINVFFIVTPRLRLLNRTKTAAKSGF